jgi:hypothetical protein
MNNVKSDIFIPELVSASIDRVLEANLVAKKICRRKPNLKGGEGVGDMIHFPARIQPTANTTWNGTATYQDVGASEVTMLIDQFAGTAYNVYDLDQFMANVDIKGSDAQAAGYSVQEAIDTNIMSLYTLATLTVADTTCDETTALSVLMRIYVACKNAKIKDGDIFMSAPPWYTAALKLAGIKFSVQEGSGSEDGVKWANAEGVDIYETTQVVNTNTAAAPVSQCMFGSYDAICFHPLTTISKMNYESATPLVQKIWNGTFYGRKVVRPDLLGCATLTYTEPSTI